MATKTKDGVRIGVVLSIIIAAISALAWLFSVSADACQAKSLAKSHKPRIEKVENRCTAIETGMTVQTKAIMREFDGINKKLDRLDRP